MNSFNITMPLRFYLPRKTVKDKTVSTNLNEYRNANQFTLGEFKHMYDNLAQIKLKPFKHLRFNKVSIIYTIFVASKRRSDIGNWGSIQSKFFEDSLSKSKIIEDDSYLQVTEVIFRYGGIDVDKLGYCDITVTELFQH